MPGVVLESFHQIVVVVTRLIAQRLVTLKNNHDGAIGIELLKLLPYTLHRDDRGRVLGRQRHRIFFAHYLQLRHEDIDGDRGRYPSQDDRHREYPHEPGNELPWAVATVILAHAALTRQNVEAW